MPPRADLTKGADIVPAASAGTPAPKSATATSALSSRSVTLTSAPARPAAVEALSAFLSRLTTTWPIIGSEPATSTLSASDVTLTGGGG